MTSNQSNKKEDRVSEEPKDQNIKNTPIEETKEETSTILKNSWFDKIINKIEVNTDFSEIHDKLWNTKAKDFFQYLINSDTVDNSKKEAFLEFAFSDHGKEKLKNLFTQEDYKIFWRICLQNYLTQTKAISVYLKENFSDIVNSDDFNWDVIWPFSWSLPKKQIEATILEKKHMNNFVIILWIEEFLEWNKFSPDFQKKIIDYILENAKEIKKRQSLLERKIHEINSLDFDYNISRLIENNKEYFFEKVISLDDDTFKNITQDYLLNPILSFLESEKNIMNHFKNMYSKGKIEQNSTVAKFFNKLIEVVWVDNLNRFEDISYYDYIFNYNHECVKDIDIEKIFDWTSKIWTDSKKRSYSQDYIPESQDFTLEKWLIDKLLSNENWIWKCFKMKELWMLKYIISSSNVYSYVFENLSEKEIINYLGLLWKYWKISQINSLLSSKKMFFDQLTKRISNNKEKEYLIKIVSNENILKFITNNKDNFSCFNDILTNKIIYKLLDLDKMVIKNIASFMELVNKAPNLNFDLKLEDIDEKFIEFIKNTFFVYKEKEIYSEEAESILKMKIYKTINNLSKEDLQRLFGKEEIKNYNYFSIKDQNSVKIETWLLYSEKYLHSNLSTVCDIYDIPYNISSLKEVEKSYNEYMWTTEKNQKYLYNFLRERDIQENIYFFDKYFNEFYGKNLDINELLELLEITSNQPKIYEYDLIKTFKILKENINFEPKDFIKKWKNGRFAVQKIPDNLNELFWTKSNLIEVTHLYSNLTISKLVKLHEVCQNNITSDWTSVILKIIWWNWKSNTITNPTEWKDKASKMIIQKAIDLDDFSRVLNNLDFIVSLFDRVLYSRHYTANSKKLYNKAYELLFNLVNETDWYLDSNLLSDFVVNNIIWTEWYSIEDLDFIYNLTWINLREEKFRIHLTSLVIRAILQNKEKNIKLFWLVNKKDLEKLFSYDIDINIFYYYLDEILKNKGWVFYWYFVKAIPEAEEWDDDFPINSENFIDYIPDDKPIITLKKDKWFNTKWILPWTKAWFLEKTERKEYLKPENIETFKKFWTIVWLWIFEWTKDATSLDDFYKDIFNNISPEKSRNSILQLWEVFNIILKKEKYEVLDDVVNWKVEIWKSFREFIDKYNISDKWRTILTLMIAREINLSFSIFKDKKWEQQVDSASLKEMLLSVYNKLEKYKKIIEVFDKLPVKTSIWVEIEVTKSIAKWYTEITGGDYKNDIETLSAYSWISKWNDAVHEIATRPTDNPYLLLLELKLLEDLDFLDLNFKKDDYSKWARWLHITIWWEKRIKWEDDLNFIQNILIAADLWGLNAWKEVDRLNQYSNIRIKPSYRVDNIFNQQDPNCVEFRCLSIDKSEPFERLILAIFILNMARQICSDIHIPENQEFNNLDEIKDFLEYQEIDWKNMVEFWAMFIKLKEDIKKIIEDHNENFEKNETIPWNINSWLENLVLLFSSNSPVVSIMKETWVDINYFKKLLNIKIDNKETFIKKLLEDKKEIKKLTPRQSEILFKTFQKKIKPNLEKIREYDSNIYKNIKEYLKWDLTDLMRRITNKKRFESVIWTNKYYLKNLKFSPESLFKVINSNLVNIFTETHNLFIKKDSSNALSTLDTTIEPNGEKISDSRLTESTIFDRTDLWLLQERRWYNLIQWASENMITQAIQREILNFIYEIVDELKK